MNGAFAQSLAQPAPRPIASAQWGTATALSGSPDWVTDARRAVARLVELPVGWDGGSEPPLQRSAINSAWSLLADLERYSELPPAHVGPTLGGGLGIEWHNGSRELDLEILPDGTIEFLKTEAAPTGVGACQMSDGLIPSERPKEVRQLVRWLMTGV